MTEQSNEPVNEQQTDTRSGFVAVVGRTNVGKSTLVNALVGEKIAIVSPKPQTTRNAIRGIINQDEGQMILLDTPGLHDPHHLLNRRMVNTARHAVEGVDAVLWVLSLPDFWGPQEKRMAQWLRNGDQIPVVAALNKADLVHPKTKLLPMLKSLTHHFDFSDIFPLSALKKKDCQSILPLLWKHLPKGPPLFPPDLHTDQQERFLLAEVVREKVLLQTHQEVPHGTTVEVETWDESPEILRVGVVITVERDSQKAIILGKQGTRIKAIGIAARKELESLLGTRMHIQLFVRVREGWRDAPAHLDDMGIT